MKPNKKQIEKKSKEPVKNPLDQVIIGVRETEKSLALQTGPKVGGGPVYTFVINPRANKVEIRRAIVARYKVVPRKLRIINLPRKRVVYRGRHGTRVGVKKVMVFLQAGQTIELK